MASGSILENYVYLYSWSWFGSVSVILVRLLVRFYRTFNFGFGRSLMILQLPYLPTIKRGHESDLTIEILQYIEPQILGILRGKEEIKFELKLGLLSYPAHF